MLWSDELLTPRPETMLLLEHWKRCAAEASGDSPTVLPRWFPADAVATLVPSRGTDAIVGYWLAHGVAMQTLRDDVTDAVLAAVTEGRHVPGLSLCLLLRGPVHRREACGLIPEWAMDPADPYRPWSCPDDDAEWCDGERHWIRSQRHPARAFLRACPAAQRVAAEAQAQAAAVHHDGEMTFRSFARDWNPAACDAAQRWCTSSEPSLILVGDVGRGKTHLARAVYAQIIASGRTAAWIDPDALASWWRDSQQYSDVEARREADLRWEELRRVHVVVWDDCGRVALGAGAQGAVWAWLEHRKEGQRLLVTTNLRQEDMAKRSDLGDALTSRIWGGATVARMEGPDRRRR